MTELDLFQKMELLAILKDFEDYIDRRPAMVEAYAAMREFRTFKAETGKKHRTVMAVLYFFQELGKSRPKKDVTNAFGFYYEAWKKDNNPDSRARQTSFNQLLDVCLNKGSRATTLKGLPRVVFHPKKKKDDE